MKNSITVLQNFKRGIPLDPAIPLLGIDWKDLKVGIPTGICAPESTAALFTAAKGGHMPNVHYPDEWVNKL